MNSLFQIFHKTGIIQSITKMLIKGFERETSRTERRFESKNSCIVKSLVAGKVPKQLPD